MNRDFTCFVLTSNSINHGQYDTRHEVTIHHTGGSDSYEVRAYIRGPYTNHKKEKKNATHVYSNVKSSQPGTRHAFAIYNTV